MLMPCPSKISCPGTDDPVLNLSSENPDQLVFIGWNYGWDWNTLPLGGSGPPDNPPATCDSAVSQDAADLCAANDQITAAGGSPTPPQTDPHGNPIQTFLNQTEYCQIACPDGLPFSWSFGAGQISATTQGMANRIAASFACSLARSNLLCIGDLNHTACLDDPYISGIVANRVLIGVVVVSGALPPGLTIGLSPNSRSVIVEGIPILQGLYTFTLRLTAANGAFMQKTYTIAVLNLTNAPPDATVGTAYNFQYVATGGVAPYVFTLDSGQLPNGLSLAGDGTISGTPTAAMGTEFTVKVTDSDNHSCKFPQTMSANVVGCVDWTTVAWGVPTILTLGSGVASWLATGGQFNAAADAPDSQGSGDAGAAQNTGTVNYTGPGCNCNLHVVLLKSGNSAFICGGITITDTISGILAVFDAHTNPAGTYDIPFTLPDTLGGPDPITIQVIAQVPCLGNDPADLQISISGTLTNV